MYLEECTSPLQPLGVPLRAGQRSRRPPLTRAGQPGPVAPGAGQEVASGRHAQAGRGRVGRGLLRGRTKVAGRARARLRRRPSARGRAHGGGGQGEGERGGCSLVYLIVNAHVILNDVVALRRFCPVWVFRRRTRASAAASAASAWACARSRCSPRPTRRWPRHRPRTWPSAAPRPARECPAGTAGAATPPPTEPTSPAGTVDSTLRMYIVR